MLGDLFTEFDPSLGWWGESVSCCFWVVALSLLLPSLPSRFVRGTRWKVLCVLASSALVALVRASGGARVRGLAVFLGGFYSLVSAVNFSGMVPGVLSVSSHLVFSASVSSVAWLALLLAAASSSVAGKAALLVGGGLPLPLGPVVGVLELISLVIRPVTLAFRLSANVLAGHVMMGLVSSSFVGGGAGLILSGVAGPVLFLFECGVCGVQAYVFALLLSVYVGEWSSSSPEYTRWCRGGALCCSLVGL